MKGFVAVGQSAIRLQRYPWQSYQSYQSYWNGMGALNAIRLFSVGIRQSNNNFGHLGLQAKIRLYSIQNAPKKSLWVRIKEEAVHYAQGCRLLGKEVAISSRLLIKVLKEPLSRRELRQLKRTTVDLLRLVPFLIIVLIPFLELLLPVLLKLFPNMLPSTFESKFQEEEKRRKILKVRLQMASFLQETVQEASANPNVKDASAVKQFKEFFEKCQSSGEQLPLEEILLISKNFPDELTLRNLSRPQLVSMAKYMSLNAFGTDAFLRHQIERRLNYLQKDDAMISFEGVDSLNIPELVQACQSRGIRFYGVSPAVMRSELTQWIELHLKHEIPSSLLILSRAFILSDRPLKEEQALKDSTDALKETLSSLPHQLINEAQLKVSEAQGLATYKQKLDVLKEQEELIEDELEQEATQTARAIEKKEQEVAVKKANEELIKGANGPQKDLEVLDFENQPPITASVPGVRHETLEDSTQAPIEPEKVTEEKDSELSQEELQKLGEALKSITKESALSDVKEELEDLKVKQAVQNSVKMGEKVTKMISKIEKELSKYDVEIGSKLNILRPNEQGNVTITELEEAMKVIQQFPKDERIKKIIKKLDADGDGYVALQSLLELVEDSNKEGHGEIIAKKAPDASAPTTPSTSLKN